MVSTYSLDSAFKINIVNYHSMNHPFAVECWKYLDLCKLHNQQLPTWNFEPCKSSANLPDTIPVPSFACEPGLCAECRLEFQKWRYTYIIYHCWLKHGASFEFNRYCTGFTEISSLPHRIPNIRNKKVCIDSNHVSMAFCELKLQKARRRWQSRCIRGRER